MLRTFIQISAIVLTLGASFFLIRGSLNLTPDTIAGLSSTHLGYNPSLVKNLCNQRADTIIGFVILMVAFIFQLTNSVWPVRFKDFDVSRIGIIAGIIFSIIIVALCLYLSAVISNHYLDKVTALLDSFNK